MTERNDNSEPSEEPSDHNEPSADRESNWAQGSFTSGGANMPFLSVERLKDAFASDPKHDLKHDSSWRTHKIEQDDDKEQTKN
jgi:hypothetical protein